MSRFFGIALLCGLLGCLCFGTGDWLMLYGDTAHRGSLSWLTEGAAIIPPRRDALAMALWFGSILLWLSQSVQGVEMEEKPCKQKKK